MRAALVVLLICAGCDNLFGLRGIEQRDAASSRDSLASDGRTNDGSLIDGPLPGTIASVALGAAHTCALNGVVRCWGAGVLGRLGYGNEVSIGDNELPNSIGGVQVGGDVVELAAGTTHTCALLSTGAVRCWGNGASGRLGYGNVNSIGDTEPPSSAGDINVGEPVAQIETGGIHTCARTTGGSVRCWGSAANGQLGYGNQEDIGDTESPLSAGNVAIGGAVKQVSAGDSHTCALLANGAVRCWGLGTSGQLGYGNALTIGDDETPAGDVSVGGVVTEIAAGAAHTCALLSTGGVRCWGSGNQGQLGYGNTNNVGDNESPSVAGDVSVGGVVTRIVAGGFHTCARLNNGAVRCWGANGYGQLGLGNTVNIGDNETPAAANTVAVGGTVIGLAAGDNHTCALMQSGALRCWGQGFDGRLGYGNGLNIGDNEAPSTAGDVPAF